MVFHSWVGALKVDQAHVGDPGDFIYLEDPKLAIDVDDHAYVCAQAAMDNGRDRARRWWAFWHVVGAVLVGSGGFAKAVAVYRAKVRKHRKPQHLLADGKDQAPAVEKVSTAHDLAPPSVLIRGGEVFVVHVVSELAKSPVTLNDRTVVAFCHALTRLGPDQSVTMEITGPGGRNEYRC